VEEAEIEWGHGPHGVIVLTAYITVPAVLKVKGQDKKKRPQWKYGIDYSKQANYVSIEAWSSLDPHGNQ